MQADQNNRLRMYSGKEYKEQLVMILVWVFIHKINW